MRWAAVALALLGCTSEEVPADAIRREAARITWMLEGFLGPKFERRPVPFEIMSREDVGARVRRYAERFWTREEQSAATALAQRLYLVPTGYDLAAGEAELYQNLAVGFYDPESDRCYVVGDAVGPALVDTIAHELVHAYRDVDCDYHRRQLAAWRQDADWELGIRCLVEGDAALIGTALAYAATERIEPSVALKSTLAHDRELHRSWSSQVDDPDLEKSYPLLLREELYAPYAEGVVLAARICEQGGVAALAAAYERPPRSTEQVLHTEKYLGPEIDEPTVFGGGDPSAALGDGWTVMLTNVLGELHLRILLTEALGREAATTAAAGWDGSRYWLCTKPGEPSVFAMISTWDSAREAVEFADAWARWTAARDGGGPAPEHRVDEHRVQTAEGLAIVRRAGADVLIVDAVPAGKEDAVFDALAGARRRQRAASATPIQPR